MDTPSAVLLVGSQVDMAVTAGTGRGRDSLPPLVHLGSCG